MLPAAIIRSTLQERFAPWRARELFEDLPFGSDFTPEEVVLGEGTARAAGCDSFVARQGQRHPAGAARGCDRAAAAAVPGTDGADGAAVVRRAPAARAGGGGGGRGPEEGVGLKPDLQLRGRSGFSLTARATFPIAFASNRQSIAVGRISHENQPPRRLCPPRLCPGRSGPRGGLQSHRPPHGQLRPARTSSGSWSRHGAGDLVVRGGEGRDVTVDGRACASTAELLDGHQAGDPPRRRHGVRAHRAARHLRWPVRLLALRVHRPDRRRAEDRHAQARRFERRHAVSATCRPRPSPTAPATRRLERIAGDLDVADSSGEIKIATSAAGCA